MKNLIKLLAVLAALTLTFGLASCDNGSNTDAPAETAATNPDGTAQADTGEEQGSADGETDSTENGGSGTTTDPADPANPSDPATPTTPATTYIGTKAPDEAKTVGDIVFSDGSAMPYTNGLTLTDTQKNAAIAVIFYVGKELNSDDAEGNANTTTSRTLGVGLAHNRNGLAWCTNDANACSKNITTIQCIPSGSEGNYTFTGDKDGSDNLAQIGTFLASNSSTDDTAIAANYPAFYFAKNYKSQDGSHVSGTDYEGDWYLPTIAELFQIWKSRETVDAASDLCGGSQFGSSYYWSSSQCASYVSYAYGLVFKSGVWRNITKNYTGGSVCAVRAFN